MKKRLILGMILSLIFGGCSNTKTEVHTGTLYKVKNENLTSIELIQKKDIITTCVNKYEVKLVPTKNSSYIIFNSYNSNMTKKSCDSRDSA